MKISSLQSFHGNVKTIKNETVSQPQPQPQPESKEVNLNNMPNSNSYLMNFKGSSDVEKYLTSKEIRIDDITALDKDVHISLKDMPEKTQHLNAKGLHINKKTGEETTQFVISNDNKQKLFIATIKNGAEAPQLTYKQGKFMPEVTVKHPTLGNTRIKMLAGSEIISKDFSLVMPGEIYSADTKSEKITPNHGIAFKGNIAISTLNLEPRTQNAVDLYLDSSIPDKMTKGKYVEDVLANEPTLAIPAGGFGERLYNLTRDAENKPSYVLPTANECRIIGTSLNMAASAGIIEGKGKDKITYLSQNNEIDGENVEHVSKYKTDGGALAEGIEKSVIPSDKDLIVLNADIFTNADITRAYHALKTLPEAALIIPYYPVDANRAKSFGLLGVEQDKDGNSQIKAFVEKPGYTDTCPMPSEFSTDEEYDKAMQEFVQAQTAKDPDGDKFFANPGMYLMSKEAVNVLKELKDKAGLGANVMPEIVKMCNEGKLKNEDGTPMKVYTVPLQRVDGELAFWDDIGTAEAYLKVIKDVAHETKTKGTGPENKFYGVPEFILNDFNNNVDDENKIVFQSQDARSNFEAFKNEFGIETAKGNIFVAE